MVSRLKGVASTAALGLALQMTLGLASAAAQEPSPQQGVDPALGLNPSLQDEAASELDELDFLSRRVDEEFPDIAKTADRRPVAVTVRALNKVTAKYEDLEIDINQSVSFGSLEIVAAYCDKRPPEEFPEASAFLQIYDRRADIGKVPSAITDAVDAAMPSPDRLAPPAAESPIGETVNVASKLANPLSDGGEAAPVIPDLPKPDGRKVFSGWMFASSPALNALEHAVYDVWVIDCQTEAVTDAFDAPVVDE